MHVLKEFVVEETMRAKFTKVGCVHRVIAPKLNKSGSRVAEAPGARASTHMFYPGSLKQRAQGARAEVHAETWHFLLMASEIAR